MTVVVLLLSLAAVAGVVWLCVEGAPRWLEGREGWDREGLDALARIDGRGRR